MQVARDLTVCLFCRLTYGGSLIRPESTGFGTVYFCLNILKDQNSDLKVTKSEFTCLQLVCSPINNHVHAVLLAFLGVAK